MMHVTFLDHSGFLVELPSATLLFDYWKGELPPLRKDVPLLIFSSHRHSDHFSPAIFSLPATAFLLGDMTAPWVLQNGADEETLSRCIFAKENAQYAPASDVLVETLPSTDEGLAFLVTVDGICLFHAGDLNWWHWEGEPDPWNPDMARDFQAYTEPLRRRRIDLAMLVLDPRLEADGFRGPKYILELADVGKFLPMHQWGNFAFTERFLACYPQFDPYTVPVTNAGQTFDF